MNDSVLKIALQCPQCGAPLELQETEHIVRCSFCRVRHVISAIPCPCLYVQPRLQGEMIYVPYWRFKGTSFVLDQGKVSFKIVDATRLARKEQSFPFSLGLKVQTQTISFVQPDTQGRFLQPHIPLRTAVATIGSGGHRIGHSGASGKVQTQVGEVTSLVYAPLYLEGHKIWDAISGKELPRDATLWKSLQSERTRVPYPDFWPALCPTCGWDLSGKRDSLVQFCSGCGQAWMAGERGLLQIQVSLVPGPGKGPYLFLPFWHLEIAVPELEIHTMADFSRIFRRGSRIHPHGGPDGDRPAVFFIPAFKIRPRIFLRLARQMSLVSQFKEVSSGSELGEGFPVTIVQSEAFEALIPVLGHLIRHQKTMESLCSQNGLKLRSARLMYIPFLHQGMDYVHPELNIAIPERALFFSQWL